MTVSCTFGNVSLANHGTVFGCNAKGVSITTRNQNVTQLTHTLPSGKTLNDVKHLLITAQNCNYFLNGFDTFLKNIEALRIIKTGLKEIKSVELKPFTKITYLDLSNNLLQIIERNLFKFNTKLKYISINTNQFRHISPNVFSPLTTLNFLYITSGGCVSKSATNRTLTVSLVNSLQNSCNDINYMMSEYTNLDNQITTLQNTNTKLTADNTKLRSDVTKLKNDNTKLTQEKTNLQNEVDKLKTDKSNL